MMKSSRCFLLFFAMLSVVMAGCSDRKQSVQATQPTAIKGIATETVRQVPIHETVELSGNVNAGTSALVSARIAGTISLLKAREGDRVSKGQLLGRIDSMENTAQATGAGARVDEATQSLEEARVRKRLADTTFERFRKLYEEQAVTRQEFDQRQTEKELAQQAVSRAEAALRQAREGGRAASAMADHTSIVSPISGVVSSRKAELGATVFPTQPLFTVEDTSSYRLELSVPESLAPVVRRGAIVEISIDALQYRKSAVVTEVVPAADPASRTFLAKVQISSPSVKSGMFGRGMLKTGKSYNGFLLPVTSVFERGGLTSVWAIDRDGRARMRLVKPGKTTGEKTEILSGLADGDRIAISGIERIVEGAMIQP